MRLASMIHAVDLHCCGEPGRVIVGGVRDVPGSTMFEKKNYLETKADDLRKRMLREPRGYPAANCNLILPPTLPEADAGFVIMEQTEYPPMSGTNTICVTTALIETGMVPETRLVSVTGPALTKQRLVRCQPGADMRGLCLGFVRPGPHHIIAGSHIDGHSGHWLGPRDRQVTVLGDDAGHRRNHWFSAALTRAARPLPIIPTAALEQALGGDIPAVALIRALSAGDQETATRLGALSLVEEDLALADYVTAAEPSLSAQLRVLLNRIEQEEVAA